MDTPIYDHIPTLREMLPSTAGVPGCRYAIVSLANLGRAQREGWLKISGRQLIFGIQGPKGLVECELYAMGRPIRGQDPNGGARKLLVDAQVFEVTGFIDPTAPVAEVKPIAKEAAKPPTQATAAPKAS